MPATRFVADGSIFPLTKTAALPGSSEPLFGEMFNQAEVLTRDQGNGFVPTLLRVRVNSFGENGPPTAPLLVRLLCGEIRKSSGRSNASCTPAVVELPGQVALKPIPRFANACQSSKRFVPPLFTKSA